MAEKTSEKPSKTRMSARGTRIYCTQNAHVTYEKTCIVCGKKFTAKSDKARVCGQNCQYQIRKARLKANAASQKAVGTLTDEQRKAIKDMGGAQKIAAMPIRELTKAEKTLGWLSLGVLAWSIYDDYQRKQKRARADTIALLFIA